MLVLSRKRMEQIVIGSEIRITVVKLEGTQVRLGIEAPGDLTVLRSELVDGQSGGAGGQAAPAPRRGGRTRLARREAPVRRQGQKAGPDGPTC